MGLDIDSILEKKGLNKSTLSTMLGKSRSYVQNALKNPTLETLQSIADVLQVDIRDLFEPSKENRSSQDLIDDLRRGIDELEQKL